ncbi:MAG: AIR synthase-related protein, partial [Pseudomonadota bacterium]
EILLSEHQVKVVVALAPHQIDAALAICEKREIDGAAIGETTTNGRLQIAGAAGAGADLPVALLTTGAPSFERSAEAPSAPSPAQPAQVGYAPLLPALERLMASAELCSRRWIWEQYGGELGGRTLLGPGEDAGLIGVDGSPRALACAFAGLGRYSAADPFEGTKQAAAEAVRKIVAVGAKPLGLTACLNFGDPEHADVMGAFMSAIDGLAEAAEALRLPVVSSDVSFHQKTKRGDAPRTPIVGAVGLLTDRARRRSMGSAKPGEALYLLGAADGWLAQSVYALRELGRRGGPPPPVNFTAERRAAAFLHHLLARDFPCALHVVSEGGALTAAAEMALAANVGLRLETPADSAAEGAAFWFGEDQGRILLASEPEFAVQLFAEAKEHGVAIAEIGVFEGGALRLGEEIAPLTAIRSAHEGALPRYLA